MAKITYLLGAGASANTIPVVADMHKRMQDVKLFLNDLITEHPVLGRNNKIPSDLINTMIEIANDLNWLIIEAKNYYSIDTLAKKYYLTNNNRDYERLKKCLIIYLTIEQFNIVDANPNSNFIKNAIDNRYDSFVAAIANLSKTGLMLNDNIKILSWNYDLQMELCLQRFTNKKIYEIKKEYQIYPLIYDSPSDFQAKKEEFSMRKLNGNAIFSNSKSEDEYLTIFDTSLSISDDYTNEKLLRLFLGEISKLNFENNFAIRFFNFAWDGNKEFDDILKGRKYDGYGNNISEAEKIAEETEILVVIGYSFPIFNREIDNRLFSKMGKLRKVYIQDKDPNKIKSTMENAFEKLQPQMDPITFEFSQKMKFYLDDTTAQFLIPYELNQ